MNAVRNVKLLHWEVSHAYKATQQLRETVFISCNFRPHCSRVTATSWSCTLPALSYRPPDTPHAPGSAYAIFSALFIPEFQPPSPYSSCKPLKPPGRYLRCPLWPQEPRRATFSGYRCSRCGRQRPAGTLHQTGQKPPGRQGRWVGSSAKERYQYPDFSGAPLLPYLDGTHSFKLVPSLKSQPPHLHPAGQFKLVQIFQRETWQHVANTFD